MKNHESRPTGSTPFLEANVTSFNGKDKGGHFRNTHQKWDHKDGKNDKNTIEKVESLCYRCGVKNHWPHTCRSPKHLVELYQQLLKDKGKKIETNFVCDLWHCWYNSFEVIDFFTTLEGNN
ncbi:hypothetical protein ES288_D10G140600v1 [Gossypium darwinii]|uniref:CCHC-type domain-containing protein n=1 Tax=Gossypium darwinii TaxID=34276 RepID=A0A5D2AYL1_GOSDA|nr:hypothetical protein ES288_D10G140600v1 [Gossypium darwinii]